MSADELIAVAVAKVDRYGLPRTLENIRANIDYSLLTFGHARKHVDARIGPWLRAQSNIIVDQDTRERQDYWKSGLRAHEEQLKIKRQSARYDANRIRAEEQVIKLLKQDFVDFGYERHAEFLKDEIDRIYAMHGLTAP